MSDDPISSKNSLADSAAEFKDKAASTAENYADAAADKASDLGAKASDVARSIGGNLSDTAADLKQRASHHADDAKSIVSSMADEARSKISEIVDHQKSAGADRLSGVAQAANSAAKDLDEQNPQIARLMRDAASSVDRFAGDLRSSSVPDIVASVTNFARQQPVAFFAGSVLAGFALARFLKSEPTSAGRSYQPDNRT